MVSIIKAGDPTRKRGEQGNQSVPSIVPENLLPMLVDVQWIDIRALKEAKKFSLSLPSGDTFLVTIDGFHWLLDRMEFSNPESVADYAWNFKETSLNLETGIITSTYERNRRIGRP